MTMTAVYAHFREEVANVRVCMNMKGDCLLRYWPYTVRTTSLRR